MSNIRISVKKKSGVYAITEFQCDWKIIFIRVWSIDFPKILEWLKIESRMRILRWVSGVVKEDRMRNACYVSENIDVVSIVDQVRENRQRWFWHVIRR